MLQNPDILVEEAFAWVARWATLEPQPAYVDPQHRWRIRSSFQKAVRRGQAVRAVEMARALHRLDARYAWRSALTVAVEDIGIGSPDAVFWATAAQRAGFRKSVGELPLLIALTRCMALGMKSRSAIEIAFVTETGEPALGATERVKHLGFYFDEESYDLGLTGNDVSHESVTDSIAEAERSASLLGNTMVLAGAKNLYLLSNEPRPPHGWSAQSADASDDDPSR